MEGLADSAIIQILKQKNQKVTAQRTEIIKVLSGVQRPMHSKEIFESVTKKLKGISLDTIYRNVMLLVKNGLVSKIHLEQGGAALFEFQLEKKHYHAVCTSCSSIHCLDEVSLPSAISVKDDDHFQVDQIALEVYGRCSSCKTA
jgi:Fe2+ or Zn2+ uptake regulation protein